jgi:hypothetical protein
MPYSSDMSERYQNFPTLRLREEMTINQLQGTKFEKKNYSDLIQICPEETPNPLASIIVPLTSTCPSP